MPRYPISMQSCLKWTLSALGWNPLGFIYTKWDRISITLTWWVAVWPSSHWRVVVAKITYCILRLPLGLRTEKMKRGCSSSAVQIHILCRLQMVFSMIQSWWNFHSRSVLSHITWPCKGLKVPKFIRIHIQTEHIQPTLNLAKHQKNICAHKAPKK